MSKGFYAHGDSVRPRIQGWGLESLGFRACKGFTFHQTNVEFNMSCSQYPLNGVIYGTTIGVVKGDTRSLDHFSYMARFNWAVVRVGHSVGVTCQFWGAGGVQN